MNLLQIVLFLSDIAINTVPTGLLRIAPVGPAMPVMPIPKSLLANFLVPCAIFRATSAETAPFLAMNWAGMLKIFCLDLLL